MPVQRIIALLGEQTEVVLVAAGEKYLPGSSFQQLLTQGKLPEC